MKLASSGKYKFVRRGLPKLTTEHRHKLHTADPQPNENELVVHHIDGNKGNNSLDNLAWMTRSEHSRLHHLGENHFACSGADNANYRHGMCVNGPSKEYKSAKNRESYQRHHGERLAKANTYCASHREEKRLYDKIRYWEKKLSEATTDERKAECESKIFLLKGCTA